MLTIGRGENPEMNRETLNGFAVVITGTVKVRISTNITIVIVITYLIIIIIILFIITLISR